MPILWFLTPWLTGFDQVDIELPEDMSLREAHDIGESLQNKLEALTEVERAYVHLDYESTHRPEHTVHGYMVWELKTPLFIWNKNLHFQQYFSDLNVIGAIIPMWFHHSKFGMLLVFQYPQNSAWGCRSFTKMCTNLQSPQKLSSSKWE